MSEYGDYTHYDTLEVDEDASQELIASAYQYLCQKWHPKRHPDAREQAEQKLAGLSKAYRVISQPDKRAEYDRWLLRQRGTPVFSKPPPSQPMFQHVPGPAHRDSRPNDASDAEHSKAIPTTTPTPKFSRNDSRGGHILKETKDLPEGYEYASFLSRAIADLADWIVANIIAFGLAFFWGFFLSILKLPRTYLNTGSLAISLLVGIAYYASGWSSKKMGTPGKIALGLEVRTERLEKLSYGQAFARVLAKAIGTMMLLITFIIQPFTKKRQCLHDMAVGTVVIRRVDARSSPVVIFGAVTVLMVTVLGTVAAVAVPAYQTYVAKAKVAAAYSDLMVAAEAVTENDNSGGGVPSSLAEVGYVSTADNGDWSGPAIYSDKDTFFIHVDFASEDSLIIRGGRLAAIPHVDDSDKLLWKCYAYKLDASLIPKDCEVWREQN